jgi:acyl carrier protein
VNSVNVAWDTRFEEAVRDSLPRDTVERRLRPDDRLVDLGLDSMGMVGLLMRLESDFGVSFPDDALNFETFATPSALWAAVRDLSSGENLDAR